MKKRIISLLAILFFTLLGCTDNTPQNHFSETVKVALRDAGNTLLLANNDSTSLILPITKLDGNRYELAFQKKLSITPDSLVVAITNSLNAAKLPKQYIVEVFNCKNEGVFYSFQIKGTTESDIIPCKGRNLPIGCYTIQILFLENNPTLKTYITLLVLLASTLLFGFFYFKKRNSKTNRKEVTSYSKIGDYRFYKDQSKLIKEAVEIKLSAKECELMAMLSANLNQVVKRETLVKEIWEDHGVFVDRSLDTFISKLRKKFKDDPSISIVNVHGVGYKLEVL
ncbi:hypothetical protein GCM10022396_00910 [Flavivirga amylovorans]